MHTLQRWAPVIVVLAFAACPALAQDMDLDARLVGYSSTQGYEAPSTSAAWFMLAGLGLVALGPLFLSANRTHLD